MTLANKSRFFWLSTILVGVLIAAIIAVFVYRHFQNKKLATQYIQDQSAEQQSSLPLPSPSPLPPTAFHVPILMYHYVEHVKDKNDTIRQKLDILPETFDSQIKTLQQAGYTFLFKSDLADIIDGKKELPPKPIVLTFDDGYRDFYTDVFPIIKKNNIKVTAYIITGFIGKLNYMFLPQLIEVKQSGLVEIGAHTVHHIDIRRANQKVATAEIAGSKTELENLFGDPVLTFAYPSGFFNEKTIQVAKDAGFTTAVSTMPGTLVANENRFELFRLRAGGRTGKVLLQFLQDEIAQVNQPKKALSK